MSQEKTVHHLSSTKELNKFIEQSMQPEAKK